MICSQDIISVFSVDRHWPKGVSHRLAAVLLQHMLTKSPRELVLLHPGKSVFQISAAHKFIYRMSEALKWPV